MANQFRKLRSDERWVDCAAARAAYEHARVHNRNFKDLRGTLGPGLLSRIQGLDKKGVIQPMRPMQLTSIKSFAGSCGVAVESLLSGGDGLTPAAYVTPPEAETSSQPHSSIMEFKTPAGSFRKEGDVWTEHAPGHYNTFKELRQDDDYIYLVDPSRVKSGDINAPMMVRLPLRGGHAQWSYTNPIKWDCFTIVEPVTK